MNHLVDSIGAEPRPTLEVQVRLKRLEEEISLVEGKIAGAIASAMTHMAYPDAAPDDWNGKILTLRLPYDSLDIERLADEIPKLAVIIGQRKSYRDEHYRISLEAGIAKALKPV